MTFSFNIRNLSSFKCSISANLNPVFIHVTKRTSFETVDFHNFRSSVVTGTEMRVIWAWIPERFALFSPFRLFSTAEHERTLAS